MPSTPNDSSAVFTSSNMCGLMMAVTSLMPSPPDRGWSRPQSAAELSLRRTRHVLRRRSCRDRSQSQRARTRRRPPAPLVQHESDHQGQYQAEEQHAEGTYGLTPELVDTAAI